MSDFPTTIQGIPAGDSPGWNDGAELHKATDGSGLFNVFKAIRRDTVANLIRYVMHLPEADQVNYSVQKDGDRLLEIGDIRRLYRRTDFPHGVTS
ncbi:hypothetical protein EDF58_1011382 [Novosphingobium sp. PhB57]|jgi:hypothetical protein|uniref:hypothetical protein n=1 Tax=unclassified Novosphingobium TaxID=2644732 RepID=UPI001043A895|nr:MULTISPECIES: hypothetical protein [unclassified Novosphingobium]TCU62048.1 hypothetical protein EDF58_1011382 [Novosphingobium sp. PhB57]TDW62916.1 hypothetical protein EDF57_107314 [Novosphingobium sp. PhB55]